MRRRRHRSLLYVVYLRSPLWRLRRRIWILRAGGRCERCGSRRRLTIHHRTYGRLGHERRADVTVLCWNCHHRHHTAHSARWRRGFSAPIDPRAQAWLHGSRRIRQDWPGHLALLALIASLAMVVATALVARR